MKKILFATLISILFASCNNGKNVTIFEIGDSHAEVVNTMVNDFTIEGMHWSEDKIVEQENFDSDDLQTWITLYDCVYKGQEYYKVRVYYDMSYKVCRMELKIEKDKMKNIYKKLKRKYGESRRANLPGLFGTWEIATVYMGDIDGVVVTETGDLYEIIVVSGKQYYELKSFL